MKVRGDAVGNPFHPDESEPNDECYCSKATEENQEQQSAEQRVDNGFAVTHRDDDSVCCRRTSKIQVGSQSKCLAGKARGHI